MKKNTIKKKAALLLVGMMALTASACGGEKPDINENLADNTEKVEKVVNLFGSMERSSPNAKNTARTAHELTMRMAEKELGWKPEIMLEEGLKRTIAYFERRLA